MTDSVGMTSRLRRLALESLVIVGSILLAFASDAAWDGALERRDRQALRSALRDDFLGTRSAIAETQPVVARSLERTGTYARLLAEEAQVTTDSLRILYTGTFAGFLFQPPLSNHDGAITSGRLGGVVTPELREALGNFDAWRATYEEHPRLLYDAHYVGPTWELRRRVGTDQVFGGGRVPPSVRLTDEALRSVLESPEAIAAAEVHGSSPGTSLRRSPGWIPQQRG